MSCRRDKSEMNVTPLLTILFLRQHAEKMLLHTQGSLQHTASLLCLFLQGHCSPQPTLTPATEIDGGKLAGDEKRNQMSVHVELWNPTYPGPLRGGRLCVAFGALLQSTLITPHRTVCWKSPTGWATDGLCFRTSVRRRFNKHNC